MIQISTNGISAKDNFISEKNIKKKRSARLLIVNGASYQIFELIKLKINFYEIKIYSTAKGSQRKLAMVVSYFP